MPKFRFSRVRRWIAHHRIGTLLTGLTNSESPMSSDPAKKPICPAGTV
jgi:hypothetical protein